MSNDDGLDGEIHDCVFCDKILFGAAVIATHMAEEHPPQMKGARMSSTSIPGSASGPSTSRPPPPRPTIPLLLSPIHQLNTQKRSLVPAGPPGPPGPAAAKCRRLQRVVQQRDQQQKALPTVTIVEEGEEENGIIEISDEEQAGELLQLLDEFKVEVARDFEVKSDAENEAFRKQITAREDLIKKKKVCVDSFIQVTKEEIIKLVTKLGEVEDLKAKTLEELVELDVKRVKLKKKCEEKNEALKNLKIKKQTLQESIPAKIKKFKEEMKKLTQDLENIQTKQVEYNGTKKTKKVKTVEAGPNLPLLDYIGKKIDEKEEELGCPVCFDLASGPIYMCSKEHLVCSVCRPKMSQCPECREIYTDGFKRHRFAEKAAEELERLYRERAEVLGD